MNTKHLCIMYALTRVFIKLLQIQRVCGKSSSHISARPSREQFTFVERIMNCLIFNWRTRSYQNTLLVPTMLQHYITLSICSIQGFHSTAYQDYVSKTSWVFLMLLFFNHNVLQGITNQFNIVILRQYSNQISNTISILFNSFFCCCCCILSSCQISL